MLEALAKYEIEIDAFYAKVKSFDQ